MPSRRLLEELRAATLERRLEELGVLRSFSRQRVSNDIPLLRIAIQDSQRRARLPKAAIRQREGGMPVGSGASGLVQPPAPPEQPQVRDTPPAPQWSGRDICRHRARLYEEAHQQNPRRLSRSTCCWHQPEVVKIDTPPEENNAEITTVVMVA